MPPVLFQHIAFMASSTFGFRLMAVVYLIDFFRGEENVDLSAL